MKRHKTENPKR